jgi:hypothetical protein
VCHGTLLATAMYLTHSQVLTAILARLKAP